MRYLPSAHFHTAMLCAASMPTVTRSLPLQLKFTAQTPLVWNPCMTDSVSLDIASHTWTQGSVPIWPVAIMFYKTTDLSQRLKSETMWRSSETTWNAKLTPTPPQLHYSIGSKFIFKIQWNRALRQHLNTTTSYFSPSFGPDKRSVNFLSENIVDMTTSLIRPTTTFWSLQPSFSLPR